MKMPINNLEYLTKCPLCNENYNQVEALVLEEKENRTTFHMTCRKCKSAMIVFIVVNQAGIISMGMATDIDKEEAGILFNNEAVSADHVIEMHESLKKSEKIEEII